MKKLDDRIKDLAKKINSISNQLDEDYTSLMETTGMSEDRIDDIVSEALTMEIEKLVVVFETLNPNVFITGIQRLEDENGEMIVNLEWDQIGSD